MSYILDALRKADAQRERDPSRGIHAQPVRAPLADNRRQTGPGTGFWAAVAAGLVVLAVAGGYLYRDSVDVPAAPPPAVLAAAPAPVPSEPVPPPPATAVLPPPPPVVVAPPAPAARPEPLPAPAATVRQVSGDAAAAAPRRAAASAPAPVAAPNAAAVAVPAPPAAAPAAPAVEAASLPAGLPPDAPKLAISGGVYSANAAQRMLIVNGQVFNEGAEVSAGLVLEEIRPKAAVLKFRGSRFTVPY